MAVHRLKSGRDRYATLPQPMPDRLGAVRDNRHRLTRNPSHPRHAIHFASVPGNPRLRSMFPSEILTLIGTVIGIGVALATLILITTARINQRFDNHLARTDDRFDKFLTRTDEKFDKYLAEAASDRRAHQSSMDDFRREMQRLAERQSRLEGQPAASPAPAE